LILFRSKIKGDSIKEMTYEDDALC
jgi:hypothetical protein